MSIAKQERCRLNEEAVLAMKNTRAKRQSGLGWGEGFGRDLDRGWRLSRKLATAVLLCLALAAVAAAQSGTQELKLTVGKSVVIDYPADVGRISTSNPDIVDVVAITAREILLNAKALGQSTVVVWSKAGERSFFAISVEPNVEGLQKLIRESFPNENIELKFSRDTAAIVGRVSSQSVADRVAAMVSASSRTVINNLQVIPAGVDKQIVLRVKFAELNRSKAFQYGFNLVSTGATNTIGSVTTGQFQGPRANSISGTASNFTLSDTLNIFAFRPDLNLAATLRLLQNYNVLQILAEPNLVTSNGKEASFLAGGEFPVPILQGGGNAGAVTIQFREFGVRLTFLPLVTPNNTIKMHLRSELSALDLARAVIFGGFTIPALSTRRAETDVELAEGQSYVVAGLLDDEVTDQMSKLPGLANIPILGTLFKSRSINRQKTELVVMITPEIVNPLQPGDSKPASQMLAPTQIPAYMPNVIKGQAEHEAAVNGPQPKDYNIGTPSGPAPAKAGKPKKEKKPKDNN
jgi:pilus assembly protein CpaC